MRFFIINIKIIKKILKKMKDKIVMITINYIILIIREDIKMKILLIQM